MSDETRRAVAMFWYFVIGLIYAIPRHIALLDGNPADTILAQTISVFLLLSTWIFWPVFLGIDLIPVFIFLRGWTP